MKRRFLFLGLVAIACSSILLFAGNRSDAPARAFARLHADDRPIATAIAQVPPAVPVASQTVPYGVVDGRQVTGYLTRPADAEEPLPSIIAIHEWWGLNDNIRAASDRLAGEGYRVLAVDLYAGETADTPAEARELSSAVRVNPEPAETNLEQAYAYLVGNGAPTVGTVGWCFGGGWSLQAALLMPEQLDATVIYYGPLVTDPDELAPLEMPILGLFGELDEGIPVRTVREFERALNDLGKDAEIVIYEDADHAFANPSGTRYQPEAAAAAWEKTLSFFAAHL